MGIRTIGLWYGEYGARKGWEGYEWGVIYFSLMESWYLHVVLIYRSRETSWFGTTSSTYRSRYCSSPKRMLWWENTEDGTLSSTQSTAQGWPTRTWTGEKCDLNLPSLDHLKSYSSRPSHSLRISKLDYKKENSRRYFLLAIRTDKGRAVNGRLFSSIFLSRT